ncbi:hypothetical protein ANN_11874 [Periplaneta americana]|uniref:Golgi apparatus protein 1 n=1 Tax=Periplaneta americana TaxID=6978 RepID=A0ABQ8T815_PERAM|nr:hypothetical protein ANN_11874 [Periplaneta americana]
MEKCKTSACILLVVFVLFYIVNIVLGFDSSVLRTDWQRNDSSKINLKDINIRNKRGVIRKKLIEEADCTNDIKRLCGQLPPNSDDLFVLECVQSFKANQLSSIEPKCQHVIWQHTMDLLDDNNLQESSQHACGDDLKLLNCKVTGRTGALLACMIDRRESIKSVPCRAFIQRLEWVVFSDFRMIAHFTDDCKDDINKHECGRLQTEQAQSQGQTLVCLQKHVESLDLGCLKQVLRLSEIQADDVKLDRQLYLACTDDHLRFCPDVAPGSGKVYKCLMQHKMDRTMSEKCQEHLSRRQKLIAQDYKVSRGLARACKDDIRASHCRRAVSDDKEIRLAQILLCLESVIRNGTKVSRDCQMEMVDHRKILMEDYRLSPEIVSRCSEDISKFCTRLEVGGKTIHCLMEHTRPKKKRERVSSQCQRALELLVKETDAGEDWRVDPVLREACKSVVDVACSEVRGGDARVMSCLMDKLGTDAMTSACEAALLQIQYFVARDYKLDPQLYRECQDDAVHLCHAKKAWDDSGQMDPERGPLVLPCLYRYAYHPQKNMQLRPGCLEEIRRVMRQRAVSMDLQPEVEEVCIDDLATHCVGKTGRGEEMVCLQDKLEELSPQCRVAVSNFTEEQAERVELNPVIMSVCQGMMERHCDAELKMGTDEGDMMECLIEHKNEPDMRADYKCRAAVEHFQLISLKSYHFTYKFKEACRSHVMRYCPSARTNIDVLEVFSHWLVSQVLECLQHNKLSLGADCHRAVFNVEKQELQDSSVDYTLMTTCRHMIRQFCHEEDPSQALVCLKIFNFLLYVKETSNLTTRRYKDETTFDPKCKVIVVRRMIEQSQDYRFNPMLQKGCHLDISKFCSDVVAKEPQDRELEGKVVKCLKIKFRERKLRAECEQQVATILREAALNYQLNPLLAAMCKLEIETMCRLDDEAEDGSGVVEECLKTAFNNHRIMNSGCKLEVASLIEEAKADIHVDPLLHQACGIDVSKFCRDIPQGAGRHIQCLQNVLQDSTKSLQRDCHEMLTKRMEMFKNAALVMEPKTIEELYSQMARSPARRYFLIVAFTVVGIIFIAGLFCGRTMRRTLIMKNK